LRRGRGAGRPATAGRVSRPGPGLGVHDDVARVGSASRPKPERPDPVASPTLTDLVEGRFSGHAPRITAPPTGTAFRSPRPAVAIRIAPPRDPSGQDPGRLTHCAERAGCAGGGPRGRAPPVERRGGAAAWRLLRVQHRLRELPELRGVVAWCGFSWRSVSLPARRSLLDSTLLAIARVDAVLHARRGSN